MRRSEYITEKRDFDKITAGVLMEQDVLACKTDDSARHIASQLTKYSIGSLPVVDDQNQLVGLVSEFDVLKVLLDGRKPEEINAGEIMTRDLKVVQEDTSVMDVINLLEKEHLIRVPVLKDGKLVGIVARRDVLFGYIKATALYWP
jgi:CBS domain-containing protein